ncbi:MAG: oligosaccharide flippase family protein, partial [Anaerolineales bacterium]|nr:oligosaccharide flippase family protein [Anaerolineales bacterium]
AGLLYSSNMLVLLTSFVTALIVPRQLGAELYGDLTFITSFLLASQALFDFGVYDTGAKLLASVSDRQHQSRLSGVFVFLFAIIALAFSLFIYSAGSWVDGVFDSNVGVTFKIIAVFSSAYLIRDLASQVSKGLNRVVEIFSMSVYPALGYVTLVVVLSKVSKLTVPNLLLGKMILVWLAVLVCLFRLKPVFSGLGSGLKEVFADLRSFGFKVYTGRALNTAARLSDKMFIALLGTNTSVGFYSLARILVQPIEFFPYALSTSLFRRFGSRDRIPARILLVTILWLLFSSAGLLVLAKPAVQFIFTSEYMEVLPMTWTAVIGAVFGGMSQPFNAFLSVKGYGRELRRVSLVLAVYDVIANLILISFFGAMGAVFSYIGEQALSLCFLGWYYQKAAAELQSENARGL